MPPSERTLAHASVAKCPLTASHRAGIYARISSDREGDNLAISRQLADCEQLAGPKGWKVVERYVDSDISAYSGRRRPEYVRMLDDIEAGVVEAVLVYHADRLHRHPRELEDFIDLCQRTETKLATVTGDVDLSTHEGQLIARIQGAVARKESDDKSRRIRRKHEELASRRQASRAAAPVPTATRRTGGRSAPRRRRSSASAPARPGRRLVAFALPRPERARHPDRDREEWTSADAEADVDLGPDQRPARAPRRDRREGGVAGDHHAGARRSGCARS